MTTDTNTPDTTASQALVDADPRRSSLDRPDVNLIEHSPFNSMHAFGVAQRMATMLATSSIVPDDYRSWTFKNDNWIENPAAVGNCFVAIELANRLHTSPILIMQQVDMIHGRPAMRAKLMIGLVNGSGEFAHNLEFECNNLPGDEYGWRAWTTNKAGKVLFGPWITWKLVKAEGWHTKKGSKWITIPEMMFQYRAASWWSSLHAPHITLGLYESEEARDIAAIEAPAIITKADRLNHRLDAVAEDEAVTAQDAATTGEPDKQEAKPVDAKPRGRRRAVKTEPEPENENENEAKAVNETPAQGPEVAPAPEADPPAKTTAANLFDVE